MAKKSVISKYTGIEFEVDVEEIEVEPGRIISNITHESLERIIFNEIPEEYGVKVSVPEPLSVNVSHPVILRTISDNKGRCIRKLGEASPGTLTTQIAKDYPVTMADTRAFDRAAIAYLNFDFGDTHVYSSSEGIKDNKKDLPSKEEFEAIMSDIAANEENIAATVSQPVTEPIPTPIPEAPKQEKKEEVSDNFLAFLNAADASSTQTNPEPVNNAPKSTSASSYGNSIINIGRYEKNPKSVKWLYDNDPNWIRFMTQEYIANSPDKQAQVDILNNYISEMGGLKI